MAASGNLTHRHGRELQDRSSDTASRLPLCQEPDALLSSPGPAIIGKEGGKGLHFHSPACAEPLGRNTSYLLPQSELQPELGR